MGTPDFAVPSLHILVENRYDIVTVVTVPDTQAGRGQVMTASPVKEFAVKYNLPFYQPEKLKDVQCVSTLRSLQPDLFVVVAFRILPAELFAVPKLGAFNLHASLLPKFRGAAPINWAIMRGERETGVTTFFLQESVDTGSVILQARVPIEENETAGEVHDKLAAIGAEIVLHTVRLIEAGKANPKAQENSLATPAPKIFKNDCRVNWQRATAEVHNHIRGLSPRPGAFTMHGKTTLKLYRSRQVSIQTDAVAGTILQSDTQLLVSTSSGAIEILEIQQEGKRRLSAGEFLRGYPLQAGEQFQ